MSRTKELKNAIVNILKSSPLVNDKIKIYSTLYPETEEQKEDIYMKAKNTDASIYVTYSGKKYDEASAHTYKVFEALSIFIFSKVLKEDDSNPLDIEVLIDNITDVLHQQGYTLFEDGVRPVKDNKTGLYEAVLIIGKATVYPK